MSRDTIGLIALGFGWLAILVYFVVLAMRPRIVRMLNGSGLFFSGLGLIQASIWVRDSSPSVAWFNADIAIGALCIAVAAQSVSALRNRKAWDGVDRREPAAIGERA